MITSFLLSTPVNFSFKECLWFLDRGYDDCMHRIENNKVLKIFTVKEVPHLVAISEHGNQILVEVLAGTTNAQVQLESQISEWFHLSIDLQPFYLNLKADPDLAFLATQYSGLRLIGIPDLFEALCWSIIGQQINLTFAYKMKRAFVEQLGTSINHNENKYYQFPTPNAILSATEEALREMQLSIQKIKYIRIVAEAYENKTLNKALLLKLPDHKSRLTYLTQFKGIGEWTAQYTLMKCFRTPDAVPYGDTGISQALFNIKQIPKKGSRIDQEIVFSKFSGWQAYLVFYLWRSLSDSKLK